MCHPERSEGTLQLFVSHDLWETAGVLRFAQDDSPGRAATIRPLA